MNIIYGIIGFLFDSSTNKNNEVISSFKDVQQKQWSARVDDILKRDDTIVGERYSASFYYDGELAADGPIWRDGALWVMRRKNGDDLILGAVTTGDWNQDRHLL